MHISHKFHATFVSNVFNVMLLFSQNIVLWAMLMWSCTRLIQSQSDCRRDRTEVFRRCFEVFPTSHISQCCVWNGKDSESEAVVVGSIFILFSSLSFLSSSRIQIYVILTHDPSAKSDFKTSQELCYSNLIYVKKEKSNEFSVWECLGLFWIIASLSIH